MPDVETAKQFLDLGGLVVLAAIAIGGMYKLAVYVIKREVDNSVTLHLVIGKLTDIIERNTASNTKLHEAILAWDRHQKQDNDK